MSATAPSQLVDYSEQVARIARAQAEIRTFAEEQNRRVDASLTRKEKMKEEPRQWMLVPLALLGGMVGGAIKAFINHSVH